MIRDRARHQLHRALVGREHTDPAARGELAARASDDALLELDAGVRSRHAHAVGHRVEDGALRELRERARADPDGGVFALQLRVAREHRALRDQRRALVVDAGVAEVVVDEGVVFEREHTAVVDDGGRAHRAAAAPRVRDLRATDGRLRAEAEVDAELVVAVDERVVDGELAALEEHSADEARDGDATDLHAGGGGHERAGANADRALEHHLLRTAAHDCHVVGDELHHLTVGADLDGDDVSGLRRGRGRAVGAKVRGVLDAVVVEEQRRARRRKGRAAVTHGDTRAGRHVLTRRAGTARRGDGKAVDTSPARRRTCEALGTRRRPAHGLALGVADLWHAAGGALGGGHDLGAGTEGGVEGEALHTAVAVAGAGPAVGRGLAVARAPVARARARYEPEREGERDHDQASHRHSTRLRPAIGPGKLVALVSKSHQRTSVR